MVSKLSIADSTRSRDMTIEGESLTINSKEIKIEDTPIYDLIAEVCKIVNGDEHQIADWLISNNPKKRAFVRKHVKDD